MRPTLPLALATLTFACTRSLAPFPASTAAGPPPGGGTLVAAAPVDAGVPVDAGPTAPPPPPIDAGPGPAPAGPALPIGAATADGGVLPLTWFDGASGICGYLPAFHVEAIDVATGATRWKASWQRLLGQLPDGDLVVASGSALAVLRRGDGAVRFQCAPPAGSLGDDADWYQDAAGLRGMPFHREAPSGMMREPTPQPTPFRVVITGTGCTAVSDTSGGTMTQHLGASAPPYRTGAWTVRVDGVPDGPQALVGETGGKVRWRRALTVQRFEPCNLP